MRRSVFLALSMLAVVSQSPVHSAEPSSDAESIPLDHIWANYMPGTKDIHTLEPEVFSSEASERPVRERDQLARNSLINRIGAKLQPAHKEKPGPTIMPVPRPAFIVEGTGRAALKAAGEVFAGTQAVRKTFPPGRDLSIVFSSCQAGSRIQLRKIEREGNTFRIHYRFFADGLTAMTSHLALIPLGKIPVGKYEVDIIQSPMGSRFPQVERLIMDDWEDRLVCRPFSFSVAEQETSNS